MVLVFLIIIIFLIRPEPEKPEIPVVPRDNWARDLISYWAFDEKRNQSIHDAFAWQHHGRLGFSFGEDIADPKRIEKGKIVRAMSFDGQDDYIIVIDNPDLRISREISIAGWFQTLGASNPEPAPIWLPDFQYRRQIIIDNTDSHESFEDVQILISIDTLSLIRAGKMQRDCQDIRFTSMDETTVIPHWIQTGCNTEETKIWIRAPFLRAQLTSNFYIYYGNPQAVNESDFYTTMEVPPIKWWEYPIREIIPQEKRVKALAVDAENNIITVGSDDSHREDIQWRMEKMNPLGGAVRPWTSNPSPGTDEINDVALGPKGIIILGGYDSIPGDFQWRARKKNRLRPLEEWVFTSNYSTDSDEIKAVAFDLENNIILAGYDSMPGNAQWRVVKLATDGEKLWEYTVNPSHEADVITDVRVDSRNNIIIAGYEKSLGHDRWRIEKLSPEGKLLFSYRLNLSDAADVINAIALDSQDNVIVVGYDFFPGNAQWRMIKLDTEGRKVWHRHFNISPGFDEIIGVDVDSEDNIIIAGHHALAEDFGWRMKKFTPDGEKIWSWDYNPSPGFDELKGLVVDLENNIILAGYDFTLKRNPQWRIKKLSEKKPLFPTPEITIKEESIPLPLSRNIILAKPGSYQVSADQNEIIGFINRELISAPLRDAGWQYFVFTYDGARLKLYLNAVLVNSRALTGEIETNFNNLFIGYNFNGFIDELKIYNRALSPKEVILLYNRR